jgi:hypothetical protein
MKLIILVLAMLILGCGVVGAVEDLKPGSTFYEKPYRRIRQKSMEEVCLDKIYNALIDIRSVLLEIKYKIEVR